MTIGRDLDMTSKIIQTNYLQGGSKVHWIHILFGTYAFYGVY